MSDDQATTKDPSTTLTEQLGLSLHIDEKRVALIRATYINLAFAVGAAVLGARIGAGLDFLANFMAEWYGALAALFALNVVPMLAQGFRKHPTLGFVGLLATGTVSGLILGPLVASLSGSVLGQSILAQAIYLTLFLFVAVTYMVFALGQTYSAPRMLLSSLAITALAGCVLGIFFSHTFLQVLTTILIGALGVVGLVCGTSEVLRDESIDEPISGALMLFAAIFNIFIASVRLLAIFNSDD